MRLKEAFIVISLISIAIEFILIGNDFPTSLLHSDHAFHILKFELFQKYGFGTYKELGGISSKLLFTPCLVPFLFLTKILPAKTAYFLSYFLILGIYYLIAKRVIPKREKTLLLAILFPLSAFFLIRFGRILELLGHVPLLILFMSLERKTSPVVTGLLFAAGMTSHLPTALFYFPILAFKAIEQKKKKHILIWIALTLAWVSFYYPLVKNSTGMQISRMEKIQGDIRQAIVGMNYGWMLVFLFASFIYATASLPLFGKEGLYALPSFIVTLFPPLIYFAGVPILGYLPGINQLIVTTVFPYYAYLLATKKEGLWKIIIILTLPLIFISIPWEGPLKDDFDVLNQVNTNYTVVDFETTANSSRLIISNYLAHIGIPSPLCSTWEYSKPYWNFYNPKNCSEINRTVKFTIFPKKEEWVKKCGNYTESQHLIVLETI